MLWLSKHKRKMNWKLVVPTIIRSRKIHFLNSNMSLKKSIAEQINLWDSIHKQLILCFMKKQLSKINVYFFLFCSEMTWNLGNGWIFLLNIILRIFSICSWKQKDSHLSWNMVYRSYTTRYSWWGTALNRCTIPRNGLRKYWIRRFSLGW